MKNHTAKINKKFSFTNRFLTGMIIALAVTLTAFEWTTVTTEIIPPTFSAGETIEMDPPLRFKIKKLEEPKPQKPSDKIKIVDQIPDLVDEPEPEDEPKKEETSDATPTTDIVDEYGPETIVDNNINTVYVAVQIFAHYDECANLEGDELKTCSQLAIMEQIRNKFVVSRQLRDTGGKQAAQVSFIVDEEGNIGNIEVLRSSCKAIGRDAKKAVEKLPPMNPAIQQGRKVKLQMTIPIVVRL